MRNWLLLLILTSGVFGCISQLDLNKCKLQKCKNKENIDCSPCNEKDYFTKCFDKISGEEILCHDLVAHFNNFTCQSSKDSLMLAFNQLEINDYDEVNAFEEENSEYLDQIHDTCDSLEILRLTIDLKLYHLVMNDKIQLATNPTDQDTLTHIYKNSELKKCLCEEDLFLYNNPAVIMESEVVTATNSPKMKGEGGGKLSLNYLIKPEGDMPVRFARPYDSGRMKRHFQSSGLIVERPVVAFLDSGVDPELFEQNKYFNDGQEVCINDVNQNNNRGWNFISENNITHDDIGHGTLVAQSFKILMTENDDYSVLPIKVLDSCGYGSMYSTVCGLYFAKEKTADILNCSWGMYVNDTIMERAIKTVSQNSVIVTSAGNKGEDLRFLDHYPSEYSWRNSQTNLKNVYEVAGLCHHYSEKTPTQFKYWFNSNYNSKNIAESAVGYKDLINEIPRNIKRDHRDCECDGTSYAAPRVTAAAAKHYTPNSYIIPIMELDKCTSISVFRRNSRIIGE